MTSNFYLDRPYNPDIDSEIIQVEKKKAKERKKRMANKFLNPRPTSIYVFFSPAKGTRIKYRTSLKIEPKYWDFDEGKIRPTAPGSIELNMQLEEITNQIIKDAYSALNEKESLTKKEYKTLVSNIVDGNVSVKETIKLKSLIRKFKRDKSKYVKHGTMKEYNTVFIALSDFEEKEKIELNLDSFDKGFYTQFESFLSNKRNRSFGGTGLKNDTIYKYISTLRVFLRWCHENGYAVPAYTFQKHRSPYKKKARNDIIVLTEGEIAQLEQFDFSRDLKYDRVRDLFLFMIYTGQRFSDVIRFAKADFHDDKWGFISVKNGKRVVVPFYGYIANGLKILEKYDYELPNISNQKFNNYLKELGEMAGISTVVRRIRYKGKKEIIEEKPKYKFMTSHMGRRTAVTVLLSRGVPVTLVQKLTQHSKISTLMKYEGADTNSLIDALKKY